MIREAAIPRRGIPPRDTFGDTTCQKGKASQEGAACTVAAALEG